jgi:hypothetical protein
MALVRADVSEERIPSIGRVTIGELGTLAVTSVLPLLVIAKIVPSSPILVTMMEAICSSETSILITATRHHIQEHDILHSHRGENLRSYLDLFASLITTTNCIVFSCYRCLDCFQGTFNLHPSGVGLPYSLPASMANARSHGFN